MKSLPQLSEALDEVDDIWGVDEGVTVREWSKLDEDFTNAGYREGITAGKESALQEGFDDGFDNVGAPLGREVGILRGVASAVMNLFTSGRYRSKEMPEDADKCKEELRIIIEELGRVRLADLIPRDIQAEQHARAHLDEHAVGQTQPTEGWDFNGTPLQHPVKSANDEPPAPRPAVEDLRRIRARLADVLETLGLEITLE